MHAKDFFLWIKRSMDSECSVCGNFNENIRQCSGCHDFFCFYCRSEIQKNAIFLEKIEGKRASSEDLYFRIYEIIHRPKNQFKNGNGFVITRVKQDIEKEFSREEWIRVSFGINSVINLVSSGYYCPHSGFNF
jgi:hypothetical protein